jgi:hypothetical protein
LIWRILPHQNGFPKRSGRGLCPTIAELESASVVCKSTSSNRRRDISDILRRITLPKSALQHACVSIIRTDWRSRDWLGIGNLFVASGSLLSLGYSTMFDKMELLDRFMKLLAWLLALAVVLLMGVAFVQWVADLKDDRQKLALCRQAAACKKYSKVREECAAAGSFKTCLRIRMGDDALWSDTCSGYVEVGPALPLPRQTPNSVDCFFRTLF